MFGVLPVQQSMVGSLNCASAIGLIEHSSSNFCQGVFKSNNMKSTLLLSVAALAVQQVSSHATFQDLWVNGVDEISISAQMYRGGRLTCDLPGLLRPLATV